MNTKLLYVAFLLTLSGGSVAGMERTLETPATAISTDIPEHAKPYLCYYCNKTFLRRDLLRTHLVNNTREKPYQCYYCHQAFNHKVTLIIHIKIHTDAQPCPF